MVIDSVVTTVKRAFSEWMWERKYLYLEVRIRIHIKRIPKGAREGN
jgi:hypothetical protein